MAKVHFTKSFIETIQADDSLLTFTDDKSRGLTLLVNPSGVKSFYLVRKFRGNVERTLLGRFPELSLAEARKKASHFQVQYDAGINPNEARRQARAEPTLDAFFEVYYQDHCLNRNKRPEDIKANYLRYLSPALGKTQLSRIQRDDIRTMMRRLADQGKKRTANVAHGLLRAMLNKALAWEYLMTGKNPALYIERYPETIRKRYLQEDEVKRFHRALSLEPSEANRDAILLLLYTGIRSNNVFAMHWSEIDLNRGLWSIPVTKNGEPHVTVLTEQALDVLRRRKKHASSVFVLPGTSKSGHIEGIRKAWQRLLDQAGIDELWIHDLRRTMGSYMANRGAHPVQIAMQLGHKDQQSAKAYVHSDVEYTRQTVAQVTKKLSGKVEGSNA
jgi:integrase